MEKKKGLPWLGKKISALRRTKKYSQEELAQKAGISVDRLNKLEKGQLNPRFYTLTKIASSLRVSMAELLR